MAMQHLADQQHLQQFTQEAGEVVVWILVGLVVLWVLSFVGEIVMERLRPVAMFIVAVVFVGIVFMNVLSHA